MPQCIMGHQQVISRHSLGYIQAHSYLIKRPTQHDISGHSSHLLQILHIQMTAAYRSVFGAKLAAVLLFMPHTIKID